MVFLKKYQSKNIAIYGMGRSGLSAARKLKTFGANLFCWDDSRNIRNKVKKFNFPLKKFWLSNDQNLIDYIVISPGIDIEKCLIRNYLKKNLKKIITDLDIFFELNKDLINISITGTNGKSTTCKIIEKILQVARYRVHTAGNIGQPVLSLNNLKKKDIFILEVSSYQLQYSKIFRSKYAAILNISPDHLERHNNMENYLKIKSRIFLSQKKNDYSYINSKSKYCQSIKNIFKNKKLKSKLISVNKNNYNNFFRRINNEYFKNSGNMENLAFAYEIAKNLKIDDKIIIKAVNKFRGLPHRQEIFFSNKYFTLINDSKATSFEASFQCLSNYNKIYWIVGGLPKYRDCFNLKKVSNNVIKAYIIGKHTNFFKRQMGKTIPFTISHNLKKAINNIYSDIKNNTKTKCTILLSPAAASYDQFSNFEDRGIYFKKMAINKLKNI